MLAIQARVFNAYFYLSPLNPNHPPQILGNKVTGILFENKVDYASPSPSFPPVLSSNNLFFTLTADRRLHPAPWPADLATSVLLAAARVHPRHPRAAAVARAHAAAAPRLCRRRVARLLQRRPRARRRGRLARRADGQPRPRRPCRELPLLGARRRRPLGLELGRWRREPGVGHRLRCGPGRGLTCCLLLACNRHGADFVEVEAYETPVRANESTH